MSVTLFLNFVRAGQFRSERAYYFIGSPQSGFPTAQTNIAKDFEWSRSINKNIITTKVPSDTYTGGGIGLDIGMTEEEFIFTKKLLFLDLSEHTHTIELLVVNSINLIPYILPISPFSIFSPPLYLETSCHRVSAIKSEAHSGSIIQR